MKKMRIVALLLCILLAVVGCSSGKVLSGDELQQLKTNYPAIQKKIPETVFVMTKVKTDISECLHTKATVMAVVEVSGEWLSGDFDMSPAEGRPSESFEIWFVPVTVKTVIAGKDSGVSAGTELKIHMGNSDWISDEMYDAMQKGDKFVMSLIPSIGRLSDGLAAEDVYSGSNFMYVTEDDRVVPFFECDEKDIVHEYTGKKVSEFGKVMQGVFDERAKVEAK